MTSAVDWRTIPSLNALRAFEAAARLQNFSSASRSLNVTPAAVVQQVRALEAHLGIELVYRAGNGIGLTAEGADLSRTLGEAFRMIATGLADLRKRREGGPLQVTMTPGFARSWLMPRLGAFWEAHPDIPLIIHSSLVAADLRRDGIDVAIRFGAGSWPGVESAFLTAATDLVVGAPSLVGGRGALGAADMQALPWMLQTDAPEDAAAFRALGIDPEALTVRYFPTGELCVAAAVQGYGLAFAMDKAVAQERASGRLLAVASVEVADLAYYTVTPPGHARPEVRKFIAWLRRNIALPPLTA